MVNTEGKKLSLWALQDAMLQAEDEINSTDDMAALMGQIAGKIDNIKEVIDILEADAKRFADYAKTMAEKKKSAENAVERLKRYVTESLIAHDTTFELGDMWKVQLTSNEKLSIEKDPTENDLFDLGHLGVIRTEYSWDKKLIKKLLEDGSEEVKTVAKIEKTNSVKFTANKRK